MQNIERESNWSFPFRTTTFPEHSANEKNDVLNSMSATTPASNINSNPEAVRRHCIDEDRISTATVRHGSIPREEVAEAVTLPDIGAGMHSASEPKVTKSALTLRDLLNKASKKLQGGTSKIMKFREKRSSQPTATQASPRPEINTSYRAPTDDEQLAKWIESSREMATLLERIQAAHTQAQATKDVELVRLREENSQLKHQLEKIEKKLQGVANMVKDA